MWFTRTRTAFSISNYGRSNALGVKFIMLNIQSGVSEGQKMMEHDGVLAFIDLENLLIKDKCPLIFVKMQKYSLAVFAAFVFFFFKFSHSLFFVRPRGEAHWSTSTCFSPHVAACGGVGRSQTIQSLS